MKLYNKSKCPDEILRPLIVSAGQRVGARTGGVVVKVLPPCRSGTIRGCAWPDHYVPLRWLVRGSRRVGRVATDQGWFEIRLPGKCTWVGGFGEQRGKQPRCTTDPLTIAETFWLCCVHEWTHVKEYQFGAAGPCSHNHRWADRPEERRAMAAERKAVEVYYSPKAEAAILAFAEWLEEQFE